MLSQLALTAFCFQHRQPQTHSPRESYPNRAIHSLSQYVLLSKNMAFLKLLISVIFFQSPQDIKFKDRSISVSLSIHPTILIQNKAFPQEYRAS